MFACLIEGLKGTSQLVKPTDLLTGRSAQVDSAKDVNKMKHGVTLQTSNSVHNHSSMGSSNHVSNPAETGANSVMRLGTTAMVTLYLLKSLFAHKTGPEKSPEYRGRPKASCSKHLSLIRHFASKR